MRRNFTGSGSRYDNFEEASPLDLSRDPADNMKDLLTQITCKEMSTSKRMGYVNNFTKLIQSVGEPSKFGYSLEDIIKCLMLALVSTAKEVRAAGLRAFRHLFSDEKTLSKILDFRIDIFVVRSLDMIHAFEVERVQALRFIRKIIAVSPRLCPMSIAATLVSVGNDEGDDADRLRRACVATLCELAVKNIIVASYCGGINTIIRNVLDSQMQRFNESLMATLLYLLNSPESRPYVRSDVGLEAILAPFTDLHYRHNADTPEAHLREDRASRITASKMAIVTIFRSWAGIISLCRPNGKGVQSLLGVFCLPNTDVRKGIMEVLFEIFQFKEPEWTDDFHLALLSVDPCQMQDSWKLSEGFVAEEGKALLPHRATGRANLAKNYLTLVLAAFINAGLLESLVEVITSSDPFISVRATILLGELLHLANALLPPECSSHTHCVPMLVNTASLFEVTSEERSRASIAVNCLDRLHQTKKRGLVPCSLYLTLITSKAHTLEPKVKPDKLHRDRLTACLNKEIDDPIFAALRDTQVMMEKDFRNWDWDLIGSTLQSPFISTRKLEETSNQKFIRNLLSFYKPSCQRFCTVHISDPQAKTFSEVGCLLVDFLLEGEDVTEGLLLQELVVDIGECLQEVLLQHSKALSPSITTGVLSNNNVLSTLGRDYFLFLGKLACTNKGSKLLERTGIYQYLLELCSLPSRDSLQKLIIASLDYSHSGIPRIILSKILTASSPATRLYATSHMRVLLRARVPFFHSWGIELLVTQLYDTDSDVAMEAADVLDEACEDEANLQYLIELSPVLLHLGEKGLRLLTRFLSVETGLKYLSFRGYLTTLMDQWRSHYNNAYVRWVEELLAESLTSYVKQKDENTFVRRSNKKKVLKDAYLPPHLYGQLVQKKNGFKLLQKTNDVELFASTVRTLELNTAEDVLKLKAALWALGHVGSTNWGINFLVEEAIIAEMVHLAVDCGNFAIRGTCYYVLGLIAKTREGADILREQEWESVRHIGEDAWPVMETSVENKEEVIPFSFFRHEPLNKSASSSSQHSYSYLGGMSETERAGGVYLGEDKKDAEGSTAYDKLSGIYIGEDKGSTRKVTREHSNEGGILSQWKKNAERRRMIVTKERGHYDERSGVYIGEESPSSGPPPNEGIPSVPAAGGILERLYAESGFDMSLFANREPKLAHRRNFSEGNFASGSFAEKPVWSDKFENKRRALSNVERVPVSLEAVGEHPGGDFLSPKDNGLSPVHKHTGSAPVKTESVPMGDMFDRHREDKRTVSETSADSSLKIEIRNRSESGGTDLPTLLSLHARTESNLSSASIDSGDYLEMCISSRSRTSSASDAGGYLQQGSPTNQSLVSATSDDASTKNFDDRERPLNSSGESFQGGLSFESPPSYSSSGPLRDSPNGTSHFTNGKSESKPFSSVERLQNELESRQRSTSLTEKRRIGSPSLGIIPETRSSSFSGSTDFTKVAKNSRARSDVELIDVPAMVNLNDLHGSIRSLAEVKILSDKTIVFCAGTDSKTRALSVDSASASGLRRDRLLVNSNHLSSEESELNSSRSRGSSFETADYAKKLGLKTGDLSRAKRTRSSSSGNSSIDNAGSKKIPNRNTLYGSSDNFTVVSGDTRRNSSASPEAAPYTSSRDAFGYTALSTLRRQRSFNRDLEAKVNAFGAARSSFVFPRSMSTMDFSTYSKLDSLASISSSFDFLQFSPSNKNTGNEFLGVSLPLDLSTLFQTESYEFKGSWPDNFVASPTVLPPYVVKANTINRESNFSHNMARCLSCMHSSLVGTGRDRSRSSSQVKDGEWIRLTPVPETKFESQDSFGDSSSTASTNGSAVSVIENTPGLSKDKLAEFSPDGKRMIRDEILRLVASLNSVVASRSHQEELVKIKEKFPHWFQDLCLYCEVVNILGLYKFKIHVRRFIQGLFANVNFDPIIEQADLVVNRGNETSSSAGRND
ncbi:rapamycin-insensitive companion of mTOR-like isoform X1 [Montipora capricornis]|uniref:rapamycin-insensitive companion of mTOR-like isoform X1 n=2 Tax=Montipora capricornis TaxID=246305 RepID=UPI0035F19B41